MTTQVAAGALSHADLGKVVEVPLPWDGMKIDVLYSVLHIKGVVRLDFEGSIELDLDPHTLVTITGKD